MQSVTGYNNWLRDTAEESKNTLVKNMDRLLVQLPVVLSVLSQEEISTQRLARTSLAVIHLMTELHLLVTTRENE